MIETWIIISTLCIIGMVFGIILWLINEFWEKSPTNALPDSANAEDEQEKQELSE